MPTLGETKPLGGQENPSLPSAPPPTKKQQDNSETVQTWTSRFTKAKKFLEPFIERDQQAFEFWYMWREFRGPYRSNIFPPDVHAAVESIVPRLTKGRPRPIVLGGRSVSTDTALAVQRGHDALWSIMDMDDKFEVLVKRGTWFGFGPEKITWKTTGHEEPVYEHIPVLDQLGQPTGFTKRRQVMEAVETKDDEGNVTTTEKPKTQFVPDYHAPVSEVCDPARVFFPRGYAREEDLPWVIFQYFKRKSELDEKLYDLSQLDASAANTADDPTLDRDKVHRLPRKSDVLGQTDSSNLGQTDTTAAPDDDKDDPMVELLECWERPCKKYPKGRLVTLANRKAVLRDRPNPMPEGELPLVVFGYIEDTFNLRNVGVARELERLVLERADKRNQRMDNVSRAIDGMTLLQKDEPLEDGDLVHRPNGVIRLSELGNLKEKETKDVTSSAYQEDGLLLQDMARATGANEYVVGGGKRADETLGQTDLLVSSANERYDGVIRRLERSLNRHARLVHMLVQQNWEDDQSLDWVDANGDLQEQDFSPANFAGVSAKRLRYDAKSVVAYKEVSRKQGMQLMELTDKLLSGDPLKIAAAKPILRPLLELFDEIKVNPTELMNAIEAYAKIKLTPPPPAPPVPPVDNQPVDDVVPLDAPTPDQSQTLASTTKL
uniref:Portal protein n=1 Tax=Eiseniibacteriota bacterium TaxID=2212470 RepID=A0A832I8W4_UNCEI